MSTENENIEITCLLEALFLKYGYDFRAYSRAHIKRRILNFLSISPSFKDISSIQHGVLNDQSVFESLLKQLFINVTEMFRDPAFYAELRKTVAPFLKTFSHVKVWHAGCASGEEVYSMAILLQEEGLYNKCRLYATDLSAAILKKAKDAIYPAEDIKSYTKNYFKTGGHEDFSDYYTAKYDSVILNQALKKNIIFAEHNLVLDQAFGEMNMVVCRNVMIYFNKELQNRVLKLFYDSLCPGGILCLGSKESLKYTDFSDKFETINGPHRIFKKKYL